MMDQPSLKDSVRAFNINSGSDGGFKLSKDGSKAGVAAGGMTKDGAIKASGATWAPQSYKEKRESNWLIVQLSDKSYGYSFPNSGAPGSTTVPVPDTEGIIGKKFGELSVVSVVAIGHNHLPGDFRFSGYDGEMVNSLRKSLYLWDPNGKAHILNSGHTSGRVQQSYPGDPVFKYNIEKTW